MSQEYFAPVTPPDEKIAEEARAHHATLTKPAGSLGRLEDIGCRLAACMGEVPPRSLDDARVVVFAGDHGVAAGGVSAYPAEVSIQMFGNIVAGGAAINVLSRCHGASVYAADISLDRDVDEASAPFRVRHSCGSIDREDAMDADELDRAIRAGIKLADDAIDSGAQLLIPGDLGIGNTTPAAVLVGHVTGREPVEVVGRGTGVDDEGWKRKCAAVRDAMFRVRRLRREPLEVLRKASSPDLAAMAAFIARGASRRTPILLDGVVVTSAALMADELAPGAAKWMFAGHLGAEPAHGAALKHLGLEPLLDYGMRLGEGSGAALALGVLQSAVAIMRDMATFASAGVSEKG
ncbi:nicotinate-nucleotide--dimethylbenzimidazole phosphoribosyltransferase [Corynebacterium sp. 335C]